MLLRVTLPCFHALWLTRVWGRAGAGARGQVVVVGYFAERSGPEYNAFIEAAKADEDNSFGISSDAAAAVGHPPPPRFSPKKRPRLPSNVCLVCYYFGWDCHFHNSRWCERTRRCPPQEV
jgi:hypothetical protein